MLVPEQIDVEAHVGVVDRRGSVTRIEQVSLVDSREPRRLVGLEQVVGERAREEVAVDAVQHVAFRIAGREQRPRQHRAGVAGLEDAESQAALLLEPSLDVVGHDERVVRDQHDLARRLVAPPHRRGRPERDRRAPRARESHREPPPGRTASRRPSSSVMRAFSAVNSFDTPRLDPGSSVSPASGYARPSVLTPTAAPASGSRVTSSPGVAVERPLFSDEVDLRAPDARVDLHVRVALGAEEEHGGEEMVEPVADAGEHEDPCGIEPERDVERELEVGRVLRGGVPLDARACLLGGGEGVSRRGVEVPDRDRNVEPKRERVVDPAVGGDDAAHRAAPRGQRPDREPPRPRPPPRPRSTRASSAGITQIRFGGSAARLSRPLSPVRPSSPFRFRQIVVAVQCHPVVILWV